MPDFYEKDHFFKNGDQVKFIGPSNEHCPTGTLFDVRKGRPDGWIKVVRTREDGSLHYAMIRRELLTRVKKKVKGPQVPFDWSPAKQKVSS